MRKVLTDSGESPFFTRTNIERPLSTQWRSETSKRFSVLYLRSITTYVRNRTFAPMAAKADQQHRGRNTSLERRALGSQVCGATWWRACSIGKPLNKGGHLIMPGGDCVIEDGRDASNPAAGGSATRARSPQFTVFLMDAPAHRCAR